MKKDWVYKKLGEVANVIHGKNQKEVLSANGKYPIYGSGGTIMGYATEYLCEAGTTILGRKGTINNPQFINHKFWNVDTAFGISARKDIDSKFLYFFIKKQDWSKMNTGTTLPSLTQAIVKNVIIPLPPLSEQKEIVEYLDSSFAKIDKLKENAAKNLEEAKALFQSALKDALEPKEGWEEKTLGEMVKDVKYGTSKPACADGAYTYLRMNNITSDGQLDLNDTKTISLDDKELEKCIVRKGDILFNRTNSYEHVGKTCVFTEETPMVIAGYIIRIRLKECLNPYYMNYFFNMKDTKAKLRKISVGAVHQSNINAKAVQTVVIPLPSLSEQQSIVSFLDSLSEKVNTLQQNYSRICDECDALKQAILRQVFE